MANSKKTWVTFKGNLTIPAEMAGEKTDFKVQAGEPVRVPSYYAESVVQDGIAEFCDAPKKKTATKNPKPSGEEEAVVEKAEQLAAAEQVVSEAQAALDVVGLGKPAGPEIAALKSAQEALTELQN